MTFLCFSFENFALLQKSLFTCTEYQGKTYDYDYTFLFVGVSARANVMGAHPIPFYAPQIGVVCVDESSR